MIKKKNLLILLILIITSIFIILPNISMAIKDPISDPNAYKPGGMNGQDANIVASKAGLIFDTITTIGIITAVVTIMVIGIKYMVGSVQEKAEYKKTMIPYIIGVVLLLGISGILRVIASVVENIG